jgi:hypothetical protein
MNHTKNPGLLAVTAALLLGSQAGSPVRRPSSKLQIAMSVITGRNRKPGSIRRNRVAVSRPAAACAAAATTIGRCLSV